MMRLQYVFNDQDIFKYLFIDLDLWIIFLYIIYETSAFKKIPIK